MQTVSALFNLIFEQKQITIIYFLFTTSQIPDVSPPMKKDHLKVRPPFQPAETYIRQVLY